MTETIMCPRCGQKMKSAKKIALHGGTCGVEVCEMCHYYLMANPEALERFEILHKTEVIEEKNKEIERLHDYVRSLIVERDELLKRNTELQEKATAAENAASELCADLIAAQRASARNMLGSTLLDILRLELKKHIDEADRISTAISVIERVQGTAAVEDA